MLYLCWSRALLFFLSWVVFGTAGNDHIVAMVLETIKPVKTHMTMELGLRVMRWKNSITGLWWKNPISAVTCCSFKSWF